MASILLRHVDDVPARAGWKIEQQSTSRRRKRVGNQAESFARKVGIAEGVLGHTGM